MRLGAVSDTHDNITLARVAAAFFREQACERVLHMGDVTTRASLAPFEGLPLTVLRGNNDPPMLGVPEWHESIEGIHVGAHHGHQTWRGPEVDLLLHGHTHRYRREQVGRTLVVNPGALHRASPKTVALVELPALRVRFFEVREEGVSPIG